MTRAELEQAATKFFGSRNPLVFELVDFTMEQVRLAFEEAAEIAEDHNENHTVNYQNCGLRISNEIRAASPKEPGA